MSSSGWFRSRVLHVISDRLMIRSQKYNWIIKINITYKKKPSVLIIFPTTIGSYDAFLKIIIWCNGACWHALMCVKYCAKMHLNSQQQTLKLISKRTYSRVFISTRLSEISFVHPALYSPRFTKLSSMKCIAQIPTFGSC